MGKVMRIEFNEDRTMFLYLLCGHRVTVASSVNWPDEYVCPYCTPSAQQQHEPDAGTKGDNQMFVPKPWEVQYPLYHCQECGRFFKDPKGFREDPLRGQQTEVFSIVCASCQLSNETPKDQQKETP